MNDTNQRNARLIFICRLRNCSGLILLFIVFISGCSRKLQVNPEPKGDRPVNSNEIVFRGFFAGRDWGDQPGSEGKTSLFALASNLRQKNYNALFVPVSDLKKHANDDSIIQQAINAAHQNGILFFASIELLTFADSGGHTGSPDNLTQADSIAGRGLTRFLNPASPEVKSVLKKNIRDFVTSHNIDGLHILIYSHQVSGFSSDPGSAAQFHEDSLLFPVSYKEWIRQRITDLAEDVIAEAMLMKPYLPVCISIGNMNGRGPDDFSEFALNWLEEGIADFVIPFFREEEMSNEVTSWKNLKRISALHHFIYPLLRSTGESAGSQIEKRINNLAHEGTPGFVFYSKKENGNDPGNWPSFPADSTRQNLAYNFKRAAPGQYVGLNLKHFLTEDADIRFISVGNRTTFKKPDSQGKLGLVLAHEPDTISLLVNQKTISLTTQEWNLPYRYEILPDLKVRREPPWLEFRRAPGRITNDSVFHFLCKTNFPATAWINGDTAKVYKTGIFFSRVILAEGANRVGAGSITADGRKAFYEQEFIYQKRKDEESHASLQIDTTSIEPAYDLIMSQNDKIRIRFKGTKGTEGKIETVPAGSTISCSRNDFEGYSLYEAELPLAGLAENVPYKLKISLHSAQAGSNPGSAEVISGPIITVQPQESFPYVKTKNENSIVSYNLGNVRLGGPFLGEYSSGVIFKTDAKIGRSYRVRLDDVETGYIDERDVIVLTGNQIQSAYYITSISCTPSDSADIVSIPYLQPVPYAVFPEPDLNRIRIRIYGAMTSSTWISHRTGRKYVDKITWQQVRPETYDVLVNLYTSKIWGYDVSVEDRSLVLRLKYPPHLELLPEKPLDGIRIVIEAGHGGEGYGAEGLSGLQEKDVNLDLSLKLGSLLKSAGAEIQQVRATDTTMSLYDKRDIARFSGSDILICIHANAASTRYGYLGVGGTSTYYHNPFWAKLAEKVYDRLLELGLEEFGVVGSFNYTVIRVTQMPAILVEQAFMTQAEDEEKLADESFRREMAGKIYLGILDYLKNMNK